RRTAARCPEVEQESFGARAAALHPARPPLVGSTTRGPATHWAPLSVDRVRAARADITDDEAVLVQLPQVGVQARTVGTRCDIERVEPALCVLPGDRAERLL